MPLSREAAALFNSIQACPHLTWVVIDRVTNIAHLLLHNQWDGWHTPCQMNLAEIPLRHGVSHGRPTCFECFDQEDPAELGRETRNVMKIFGMRRGQHWHVTMFMGQLRHTLINVGNLTLSEHEWREYVATMVIGALSIGTRVIVEKEE